VFVGLSYFYGNTFSPPTMNLSLDQLGYHYFEKSPNDNNFEDPGGNTPAGAHSHIL
jgi:hypothetical protein